MGRKNLRRKRTPQRKGEESQERPMKRKALLVRESQGPRRKTRLKVRRRLRLKRQQ